jgi:hypothetical protein
MSEYIYTKIKSLMLPSWSFEYNAGYIAIHQNKHKSTVI